MGNGSVYRVVAGLSDVRHPRVQISDTPNTVWVTSRSRKHDTRRDSRLRTGTRYDSTGDALSNRPMMQLKYRNFGSLLLVSGDR
jgi:hypothetical protein